MKFNLKSEFIPTGDQPAAINDLVDGIHKNVYHQTLLGCLLYTSPSPRDPE